MNYGKIIYCDVANGEGCRTSLFVSGCTHHCPGCFNPETWAFDFGEPFDETVEKKIVDSLEPSHIAGLTILGGEPMEISNQEVLYPFLKKVKESVPDKTVWIYSGFTWEELNDRENRRCHGPHTKEILSMTDVLVDGRFIIEKKDITLAFRGSSNQRILDAKKSLVQGKVTEYNI